MSLTALRRLWKSTAFLTKPKLQEFHKLLVAKVVKNKPQRYRRNQRFQETPHTRRLTQTQPKNRPN